MKKSKWQPGSTRPKLIGWYQCKAHGINFYEGRYAWRYWNGDYWEWDRLGSYNPKHHPINANTIGILNNTDFWRGLVD